MGWRDFLACWGLLILCVLPCAALLGTVLGYAAGDWNILWAALLLGVFGPFPIAVIAVYG